MDGWLTNVLTNISAAHRISDQKAKTLLNKIFKIIFDKKEESKNSNGTDKTD